MNHSAFTSPKNTGLLANRYQLKQLIGRGGMGEVFLADDILLGGIPVAVKFLSQTVSSAKMKQDFIHEALMSAALGQKSLHIVRTHDYGVSETGKPFYVMEYLNGKSLKDLIPLSLPDFLTLVRQICLGLQCAHQGININGKIYPLVHRDIKPANILVVPDPILGQLVKILDFGIARFFNYPGKISANQGFNGTLPYCSPEELEEEKLDSRSDIYSLGVMMFEMLTGAKPWEPETNLFGAWYKAHHFEAPRAIADVNPQLQLPQQLNDLIMACLAKKPSDRPQNIAEILQILNSVEKSISPAHPATLAPPATQNKPVVSDLPPAIEKKCWQLTWPENKPIQEIVFPRLLDTAPTSVATISLMLPRQEIHQRAASEVRNQLTWLKSPHPMLLWLTVIHTPGFALKWLPCYLDLQNPQNHQLVYSLAKHERYPVICFTLEAPHDCAKVLCSFIELSKRQMLTTWVEQSKSLPPSSQAHVSKNILKQQYQQMRSQMLEDMS
ncbi:serine/threonine protein kinase [Nodularia sphaerocarpa]|uniref:serine/threonine protein kinase n=1 Tax=Nodularia sphaerocarpa TaxID=137816 RepID=UPI001EFC0A02|nr:serine/threonine-protein kinase [Nodularia sphaerocarpa]MDB9375876.1 serine/threonine-protein kinase [Nodularia sphaerocarpa CS-585]MDB9379558.1 serine/threonine-protein kinase [Nodularia sphaerocarpa CS-585A2]ULP71807.1 Serine/threonine-protein kinase A [Nodularia sphaerocarpa UHCC 0038]